MKLCIVTILGQYLNLTASLDFQSFRVSVCAESMNPHIRMQFRVVSVILMLIMFYALVISVAVYALDLKFNLLRHNHSAFSLSFIDWQVKSN